MFRDIRKKKKSDQHGGSGAASDSGPPGRSGRKRPGGLPLRHPHQLLLRPGGAENLLPRRPCRSQGGSHPGLRQGVLHCLRRRDDPGGGVGAVPPERRGVRPVPPAGAEPGDYGAAEALRHEVLPGGAVGRRGDPAGWRCRPALRDRDTPPQRKRSAGEVSISSPVCSCRNRKKKNSTRGPNGSAGAVGAGDRTRTGTLSPAVDFESTTSTNSITPAEETLLL